MEFRHGKPSKHVASRDRLPIRDTLLISQPWRYPGTRKLFPIYPFTSLSQKANKPPSHSVRTLAVFFGPILLPKAISYYRSIRNPSRAQRLQIQSLPPPVGLALGVLGALALAYLVQTLPFWAPENLFVRSDSRLQIPVDVLFNRVGAIRELTPADDVLRAKFVNLESRLLYLQFGPDVMVECPFCNADEPKSYFNYALPSLLWPHIANLIVIAAVTSPTWTGRYGLQWRSIATIAAGVIGALEVYFVSSYNYQANSRALKLANMDMFFWSMRIYRFLALATLNAGLTWVLYLSSTNRAFGQPPGPSERVEMVSRALGSVKSKMSALAIVRNTALRDEDLRGRSERYWAHEGRLMAEVMEDREVVEGVNNALEGRIKIGDVTRDADQYAQAVLSSIEEKKAQ